MLSVSVLERNTRLANFGGSRSYYKPGRLIPRLLPHFEKYELERSDRENRLLMNLRLVREKNDPFAFSNLQCIFYN